MHRKDLVMSDAIDRVSLYTPGDKLSLMARRERYADFVGAGKPGTARIDDGPATGNLPEKRIKAEAMASSSLINPLPEGAIVRTDEGSEEAHPSDDVRLSFGKALLAKAEGADASTAAIIAKLPMPSSGLSPVPMIARK
jgi:hypothetical protein